MKFDFKKNGSGKPRTTMSDDESHIGFGIFKNVSHLKLTYQIKLLGYRAAKEDKILVIKVPEICELSPALKVFQKNLLTEDGQQRIRIIRIK